ncbi:MAG: 1-phosphofructokinase family hexose kinase [Planctomycetales bacterium]
MILAAGLSPAWQQIVLLERFQVGEVNRARQVQWCGSGKVLNVALALRELSRLNRQEGNPQGHTGELSRAVALVGGQTGDAIQREFTRMDLSARWVTARQPTRVCTTILDQQNHTTTELVQNAGAIEAAELEAFRQAFVEEAATAEVVILTGSFPAGTPATFYRELIKQTCGRLLVDAQGEPLLESLAARPFLVKPNREELGRTLARPVDTLPRLHAAMRELNERGAAWVVVTEGKARVWISSASTLNSIEPPQAPVVNPIGCGDCLAAGIAVGLATGYDPPRALALGVAAAASNIQSLRPGQIDRTQVQCLEQELVGRQTSGSSG